MSNSHNTSDRLDTDNNSQSNHTQDDDDDDGPTKNLSQHPVYTCVLQYIIFDKPKVKKNADK